MPEQVVLAIDVVLGALIGPPGCGAEMVIERSTSEEWLPVIPDLAMYCAFKSIRPGDVVDHERFATLMKYAVFIPVSGRDDYAPHPTPTADEIEHWRSVVLGP